MHELTRHEAELDAKANAIEALRVADFPLVPEDHPSKYEVVTNWPIRGIESLLPAALFAPTPYYVGHPELARSPANPYFAAREIMQSWVGNLHAKAVLRHHLGQYSDRVGSHILMEMIYLSSTGHRANIAFSAARMLVDAEAAQETVFAMWDDGTPYESAEDIEQRFSKDAFRDLSDPSVMPQRETVSYPANPTVIVNEVTAVFNGTLSALSGEHRVDISKGPDAFEFEPSTTPGIIGNLVIARLPHVNSVVPAH